MNLKIINVLISIGFILHALTVLFYYTENIQDLHLFVSGILITVWGIILYFELKEN